MSARAHVAALEALLDQVHEYFLVRLPDHVRRMYAQDLAAFPIEHVRWAIDVYRLQPPPAGHKKAAPKPLDLIALLHNEMADKQAADSIASAIWGSIALFGRTQAKAAMARIGAEGEKVVQQMGGWELLCRSCCADDANIWHAQLRDKALAVLAQKSRPRPWHRWRRPARTCRAWTPTRTKASCMMASPCRLWAPFCSRCAWVQRARRCMPNNKVHNTEHHLTEARKAIVDVRFMVTRAVAASDCGSKRARFLAHALAHLNSAESLVTFTLQDLAPEPAGRVRIIKEDVPDAAVARDDA